ncbi:MAG: lysyl oxidase family protein [Streptosporangiaceae bacterium]
MKGSAGALARPARDRGRALASLPRVPYLAHPPAAALPDPVPLPSWNISTSRTRSGPDLLNFNATVWIGGNSQLDVEGFRSHGSPIMKAYQYFWRNGHAIGRVRAGTMGFDSQHGHNHWHFEQFARYTLLDSAKKLAVRSHKMGFCITPTDPVALLAPHAVWQPAFTGLAGACGSPTALSVQEILPVGWGDTYLQSVAGQAFDITNLPNGTYYIEVTANPGHVLYESNTGNNVSLRKVILGGTPGHRTVRVPPWHGLDPGGS